MRASGGSCRISGPRVAAPLAEPRGLVPVAARGHAAPPPLVRPGAVIEPEDAVGMLAFPDHVEVTFDQQPGDRFGERPEQGCERIAAWLALEGKAALAVNVQVWRADVRMQVGVQSARGCGLALLARHDQRTRHGT